jgi:hypothetical protein
MHRKTKLTHEREELILEWVNVADPDPKSCTFSTPGSGMGKNQDPDPVSGMNNPDHIY